MPVSAPDISSYRAFRLHFKLIKEIHFDFTGKDFEVVISVAFSFSSSMNFFVILSILAICVLSGVRCKSVHKESVQTIADDDDDYVEKTIIENDILMGTYVKPTKAPVVEKKTKQKSPIYKDPFNWPFTGLPYMKYTTDRIYFQKVDEDNESEEDEKPAKDKKTEDELAEKEMDRAVADFLAKED